MSDDIRPALTPEEWAAGEKVDRFDRWDERFVSGDDNAVTACDEVNCVHIRTPKLRHALAALALHGQPFGFTHADVALVRDCVGMEWGLATREQARETERRLLDLVARLAALLPPSTG